MSLITEGLQTEVEILGKPVRINTNFRNGIKFEKVMMDASISEEERVRRALRIWYGKRISETGPEIEAAMSAAIDFWQKVDVRSSENDDFYSDHPPRERPLIDYEADADYIYAAFYQTYGIDLSDQSLKLHWHQFQALFAGLPEDCRIMQIIGYRSAEERDGMSESEKKEIRRMHQLFDLPVPELTRRRQEALLESLR